MRQSDINPMIKACLRKIKAYVINVEDHFFEQLSLSRPEIDFGIILDFIEKIKAREFNQGYISVVNELMREDLWKATYAVCRKAMVKFIFTK